MNERQTAEWLMEQDDFLILTHVRPDGDTIGCAARAVSGPAGRGKTAWVLENPEATSLFTPYLEGLTAPEGWSRTPWYRWISPPGAVPGERPVLPGAGGPGHRPPPLPGVFARETCLDAGRAACRGADL